jgi:hypothetical protein
LAGALFWPFGASVTSTQVANFGVSHRSSLAGQTGQSWHDESVDRLAPFVPLLGPAALADTILHANSDFKFNFRLCIGYRVDRSHD